MKISAAGQHGTVIDESLGQNPLQIRNQSVKPSTRIPRRRTSPGCGGRRLEGNERQRSMMRKHSTPIHAFNLRSRKPEGPTITAQGRTHASRQGRNPTISGVRPDNVPEHIRMLGPRPPQERSLKLPTRLAGVMKTCKKCQPSNSYRMKRMCGMPFKRRDDTRQSEQLLNHRRDIHRMLDKTQPAVREVAFGPHRLNKLRNLSVGHFPPLRTTRCANTTEQRDGKD